MAAPAGWNYRCWKRSDTSAFRKFSLVCIMASYQVKSPWWLRTFYSKCIWRMPQEAKPAVYLTFDDGPNELATPFVLDELKKFDAQATFFCIGKNVVALPEIYDRVLEEG